MSSPLLKVCQWTARNHERRTASRCLSLFGNNLRVERAFVCRPQVVPVYIVHQTQSQEGKQIGVIAIHSVDSSICRHFQQHVGRVRAQKDRETAAERGERPGVSIPCHLRYPSCPLIGFFLSSQEVIAILETLKHKHVTEAILRVGVAPRFSAFAA